MQKKIYNTPHIELLIIDNNVALILESNPPIGPDETREISTPDFLHNNHFKNVIV
jgi:hypothetical protein